MPFINHTNVLKSGVGKNARNFSTFTITNRQSPYQSGDILTCPKLKVATIQNKEDGLLKLTIAQIDM